jgi:hypothetical protein
MYPDDTSTGTGPSRGRLAAIFSGLALLGLVIGVSASQLAGTGDDSTLIGATPATSSTSSTDPSSATDDPGDDVPSPSSSPRGTPNYRAIPVDTGAEPGLDFGFLTRVVRNDGTVTLRFDRASFFTGDEATKHNKGKAPDNDYLIENTNPAQRSFQLDPKASIIATNRLLTQVGEVDRQTLTVDEFVANSTRVLTGSTTDLPVWLRHTDGLSGPVTSLAEQYLP